MTVKELFEKAENGTLTYDEFVKAAGESKFVDLTEGKYVSKNKYDDDIKSKDATITTLNDTIKTRDTDLQKLQDTLKDVGDINVLQTQLTDLQTKYDDDTKAYQAQLQQQAYEFAVREFANGKNFTSRAAKRDFTQAMIAKKLQLDDSGNLVGAEEFTQTYEADNADAFVKTEPKPPKPQFSQSTEPKKPGKLTLSQMMQMKNENPDAVIDM